jgi:hypothetical protein
MGKFRCLEVIIDTFTVLFWMGGAIQTSVTLSNTSSAQLK